MAIKIKHDIIKHNHHGTPKPIGINPKVILTPPTTNAYGIWDFTWLIWSQPEAIEDKIVVSDIGEQWSPQTEPHKTADTDAYKIWTLI